MDKNELKKMANNPDFIPGIYNYCDRWCERCPHTSECFLFATEKKQEIDGKPTDLENDEFWAGMEEIFTLTFELLEDASRELGIDLEKIDTETHKKQEEANRREAREHAAVQESKKYIDEVSQWFDEADPIFQKKGEELKHLAEMGLAEKVLTESFEPVQNFVEIIRWYQHQLYAKIMRALLGRMDELPSEDSVQNDHNGSARVALIGIKRSIAAWGGLLHIFSEREDSILKLLVRLANIRKQLLAAFPLAPQFKRPGFDD